jgi:hypothetical protein
MDQPSADSRALTGAKPRANGKSERFKAQARSRVSNGRDVLPGLRDGRTLIARRYRDIMSAIVTDQGGAGQISEARLQLTRRFAAAAVQAEMLETKLANGEQIDIAEHALLASTLVRIARQIGVDRVAKEIGLSLGEIMREHSPVPRRAVTLSAVDHVVSEPFSSDRQKNAGDADA